MTTYSEVLRHNSTNWPSLYKREEDVLHNLFLTLGNVRGWINGELDDCICANNDSNLECSIDYLAKKQSKDSKNENYSYWFDFFTAEYNQRTQGKRYPGYHFSPEHCQLNNISDDINQDWAIAVVKCATWVLDSCNDVDGFFKHSFIKACRWYYAGTDKIRNDIAKENPDKTDYEINCLYADHIEKSVTDMLIKKISDLKEVASNALNKCRELHDIPTDIPPMQIFPMDMSKPEWYIEIEDRVFKRNASSLLDEECILTILRHKKTAEEIEKENKKINAIYAYSKSQLSYADLNIHNLENDI